ncbi:ornithine cyclodeaminase family protein [Mesorhizobium sp.]|uniref:ornithine cyclodeaminase family protein n=1 Tax=Mesorhizobium sp. TaxID=1871066 RepID=UPI0025DE1C76|nr:ornithine cyclodeaminase family protein [Mesorhizobium sp.]
MMEAIRKSAAEIEKGDLPILVLSEADVKGLIDPLQLLDALADGFRDLSAGLVQAPERPEITIPRKGFSLAMPAWRVGMSIAVKVVNVFEANLDIGLTNHLATINLFDPSTGAPQCVMDGTYITAIRTAASAVLSVRQLSRRESRTATIVGAGVQGRQHLDLLPLVRDFDEIRVASLHHEDAISLAKTHPKAVAVVNVKQAVGTSDVVCLASHSYQPVIEAGWVRPGTHVSSVGYAPPSGELPRELLDISKLFVETADAFKSPPVGCAELKGWDVSTATLLGDAISGKRSGRESAAQITLYKAMGVAMEDLVAANLVYSAAKSRGVGQIATL